ncbi:MAG: NAD-dependent epimerase/dehydratase family protein [Thermoproteota archaeon]
MTKIVVTGGAGFIGSHLSRRLSELGHSVVVYDDFSNPTGVSNLTKNIKIVKGDILDYDKLRRAIKGAEVVFHLAVKALPMSFTKPREVVRVNDEGSYLACKACHSNNVQKMIYVSSSEVYGTAKYFPMNEEHPLLPTTIYAASKAAGEMYAQSFYRQNNLPVVIVRPFNSYGPYMRQDGYAAVIPRFVSRSLTGLPPIIFGDGKQTRDFTYVDDTVDGMVLALEKDVPFGLPINLARGIEVSVNDMAWRIIKTCNEILDRKNELYPIHEEPRQADVRRHLADVSLAQKHLGFRPKVNVEEGIIKYIKWHISRYSSKALRHIAKPLLDKAPAKVRR